MEDKSGQFEECLECAHSRRVTEALRSKLKALEAERDQSSGGKMIEVITKTRAFKTQGVFGPFRTQEVAEQVVCSLAQREDVYWAMIKPAVENPNLQPDKVRATEAGGRDG